MGVKLSKKMVAIGAGVSVLVCLYIFIHSTIVTAVFKLEPSLAEYWPALMGPNFINLLGGGKKGTKTFISSAAAGLVLGCSFKLLEAWLFPKIGVMGSFLPLFVAVTIIISLGPTLPTIFSPVAFIVFSASTLVTTQMLFRTSLRFATLLIGFPIFYFIELKLIAFIAGRFKDKPAPVPATE